MIHSHLKKRSLVFLTLLFGCLFFVNAQEPGCTIKVKAIDAKTNTEITDPDIRVIDYEKKTIFYESLTEPNIVEFLPSGNYSVSVFKEPFSVVEKIALDCDKTKSSESPRVVVVKLNNEKGAVTRLGVIKKEDGQHSGPEISNVTHGAAIKIGKPAYPPAARVVRASGSVEVSVIIDMEGNVVAARAVSGHPLLRRVSEKAAVESVFRSTSVDGKPVEVSGILVYNFKP
ncbi:MAG: energy transducer TonB [Pyrinomonadaceae bacterium]